MKPDRVRVIGHEIIHSFDNSGRKFDAKENQVDWWTAEDAKRFEEGANCIIRPGERAGVRGVASSLTKLEREVREMPPHPFLPGKEPGFLSGCSERKRTFAPFLP